MVRVSTAKSRRRACNPAIVRGSSFDRTRTHKRRGQMESSSYFHAVGTQRIDCIEDVAKSDRRGAGRYRTLCRIAAVRRADDIGLWRVRNISNEGLMLSADPGDDRRNARRFALRNDHHPGHDHLGGARSLRCCVRRRDRRCHGATGAHGRAARGGLWGAATACRGRGNHCAKRRRPPDRSRRYLSAWCRLSL